MSHVKPQIVVAFMFLAGAVACVSSPDPAGSKSAADHPPGGTESIPPLDAASYRAEESRMHMLHIGNRTMTPEQVTDLENRLSRNSNDLEARIRLVLYYGVAGREQAQQVEHIAWFVKHHPSHPVLPFAALLADVGGSPSKAELDNLWNQQLQKHASNAIVLGNAARWYLPLDSDRAHDLFDRARRLDPQNPDWFVLPGLALMVGKKVGKEQAHQAFTALRQGLKLYEVSREMLLPDALVLSQAALAAVLSGDSKSARELAERFLAGGDTPMHGIHEAHTVLGLVALEQGDLAEAGKRLVASCKLPEHHGKPDGPLLMLADGLLERDQRKPVIAFFEACEKVWPHRAGEFQNWSRQIQQGKHPRLPDRR
jgi:TolA-binding protein